MKAKSLLKSNITVRHWRIRKKVVGTSDRPRLCLSPSTRHLQAQLVDDFAGKTLVGFSTRCEEFLKSSKNGGGNVKSSGLFGQYVAKKAIQKGIKKVVFDRSGYQYHGRVKALADGAREGGLQF